MILSFVAIAVFGFVGMGHGPDHNNNRGCLATTATGGNCPAKSTPLGDFNFYLTVFRSFSQATPTMDNVALILLALLIALAFGLIPNYSPPLVLALKIKQNPRQPKLLYWYLQLKHWLSLLKLRDAALLA